MEAPKESVNATTWLLLPKTDTSSSSQTLIAYDEVLRAALLFFALSNIAISLFGIVTNTLNLVVFIKQGLKETINISLSLLALADFFSLAILIWVSICHAPPFIAYARSELAFDSLQVVYLTGGVPKVCISLIAACVTAFIATERCVCVIQPLKVKLFFTRTRLAIMYMSAFIAVVVTCTFIVISCDLGWKYDPKTNTTLMGLVYANNWKLMAHLALGSSVIISTIAFIIVCIATFLIHVTITRQRRWRIANKPAIVQVSSVSMTSDAHASRNDNTAPGNGAKATSVPNKESDKNARVTKTVVLIAVIFIIFNLPGTINRVLIGFLPGYSKLGHLRNLFEICTTVTFTSEAIGSGVNIFVYIKTSTRFKLTLMNLFPWCSKHL